MNKTKNICAIGNSSTHSSFLQCVKYYFSVLTFICTISIAVSQNLPSSASQTKVDPASANSALQVNAPLFFYENTSSPAQITADVNSTMNSTVKIECYAGGSPSPTVYITRDNDAPFRNGQTIHQGNVVEIENITKKEEGMYHCFANSTTAPPATKHILVEVRVPPIIRFCNLRVNYYPGASVITQCEIESHVTPVIFWFENKHEYNSSSADPNFESTVTSNGKLFTATLKINSAPISERTYYSIKASNSLGEVEAVVGQFSSYPNDSSPICPTSSSFVSIFFTIIVLVIIAFIVGAVIKYWEKIKNFRNDGNQSPSVGYRVPTNDF